MRNDFILFFFQLNYYCDVLFLFYSFVSLLELKQLQDDSVLFSFNCTTIVVFYFY